MGQKPAFYVPFVSVGRESQEIEIIGVFEELLGEIGLRRWKGALEIRDRFSLAVV